MTAHHSARVADRVRRILAQAIQSEVRDPGLGFVTLTSVKLSPDLHYALVYVTILGDQTPETSLRALNRAVPFLRRTLARRAGLRHTPELRFVSDEAAERGMRLEELFDELRDERERRTDET